MTHYFYKDKTTSGRTFYRLIKDGQEVGQTFSRAEALEWYRRG